MPIKEYGWYFTEDSFIGHISGKKAQHNVNYSPINEKEKQTNKQKAISTTNLLQGNMVFKFRLSSAQ